MLILKCVLLRRVSLLALLQHFSLVINKGVIFNFLLSEQRRNLNLHMDPVKRRVNKNVFFEPV